jgi:predicted AlkP superfamily pyrophosphatase or phosphodiesterase
MIQRRLRHVHVALVILLALVALRGAPVGGQAPGDPILILISFDGWRWDYIHRADVPNLKALAARGVRAERLVPSFPTVTFPNHYTIVTGLYPDHHGIVSNTIVEPGFPLRFTMNAETAKDPRWWGGEPLWVTAIRQGRRASSMFWPGSEVAIGGVRPTAWKPYNTKVPNADRVKQVLDWLALPADQQPAFITLYFSEVDTAGHDFGPESSQVLEAARHLDEALGQLLAGVDRLNLRDRLHYVIVSDHGMAQLSERRTILLDDYLDLATVDVVDWGALVTLRPKSGSIDEAYRKLKGKHPRFTAYTRELVPDRLHYGNNQRIPDVVALADDGWRITSRPRLQEDAKEGRRAGGAHGYDTKFRSMHGLFVAAGPRVRERTVVKELENIHLYEFMCAVLGLAPAPNDGHGNATRRFLKPSS